MARTAEEEESYIFSPTGAGGLPTYDALEQRRRVAAAIMARRNERPKTLGEGLSALGEAWGDRGLLQEARDSELAARDYATKALTGLPTIGATPEPPPYNPNAGAPPPVAPGPVPPGPTAALPPTDISASAATPPDARAGVATALAGQVPPAVPPAMPPAVPPAQVAQATGIAKAPAGPLPQPPVRPPLPTPNYLPTVTPEMQRLLRAANDPYLPPAARAQAAAVLQAEQERIKTINTRLRHEYEPHQRIRLEEEAAARDPQKALNLRKTQQEIDLANRPKLEEKVEEKLIYDPVTGTYKRPVIEGADPNQQPTFSGTEFQGKALVNYGRARLAHEGLTQDDERVLSSSPGQSALGTVGASPLQNPKFRRADTSRENFVQAFIRQQSGGAYTTQELDKEARAMLPAYGDTPQQLADKRAQREQFLGGLSSIIGPRGMQAAEWTIAREREAAAARQPPVRDFANEAEAAAARLKPGTRVRINGRVGVVQ